MIACLICMKRPLHAQLKQDTRTHLLGHARLAVGGSASPAGHCHATRLPALRAALGGTVPPTPVPGGQGGSRYSEKMARGTLLTWRFSALEI